MNDKLAGEPKSVSATSQNAAQAALVAVVDDDEDVRAALEGLLGSLGYRASLHNSADNFLAARVLDEIDCIISDVQMPGTSGIQLAERVKASGKPIILITAFPTAEVTKRAKAAGVQCVLIKPFESEELIQLLAKLLS